MFLQPKNRKYVKDRRSPIKGLQGRSHRLVFGSYGLKYIGPPRFAYLTAEHCEAVRRVISRLAGKARQIFIRIFPYKPITKKPTKTRMGKGKGSVNQWVCPIKPGQILFEISGGMAPDAAKEILERASHKLPVTVKFVDLRS